MWDILDLECLECEIFGMWSVWDVDVRDMGCLFCGIWGCGMFRIWDVQDVKCLGCEILRMWAIWDMGCSRFGMWDRNVYWDVGG